MIINSDCLEWMKTQPDNSIDCVITDPPYGLKFMSKKWDYELPSVKIWQEALRICKPGSWLLAFGGSRTYHRLTCSIEDAGWEIRDCIMWMHGQGFPKGNGCLKPAYEPIILARKRAPKPELNIDECRISTNEEKYYRTDDSLSDHGRTFKIPNLKKRSGGNISGRWPANVILDEIAADLLDQQSGISKSSGHVRHNNMDNNLYKSGHKGIPLKGVEDSGGASRFFYCAKAWSSERNRGCEQLPLKTKGAANGEKCDNTLKGPGNMKNPDKNAEMHNFHPTVKPLKLMEYLIKLVVPKNGVILDPFCGSGTTLVAAKKLGYKAIGIELDPEYCKIAQARVNAQEVQLELPI